MATGFLYDPRYLQHETGTLPEQPVRLEYLLAHLRSKGLLERFTRLSPRMAEAEVIRLVHPDTYLRRIHKASVCGYHIFDHEDVALCPVSLEVAQLAVGGVLTMCDAVMRGEVANGFCAVRPPGHHAEAESAMGFCLLNNVAIGAKYLQQRYGLQKIAIVDWDLHHGNGTQHIFEDDPTVFFISLHEHTNGFYPGTGGAEERGRGAGEGFTLNIPFLAGARDRDYQEAFDKQVIPALRNFGPEFILISAGFDAHQFDPLGHLCLTAEGYGMMTRYLKDLAEECCAGRLVSVLEGGYNIQSLAWSVQRHLEVLAGITD